jgi:hypothetical protein
MPAPVYAEDAPTRHLVGLTGALRGLLADSAGITQSIDLRLRPILGVTACREGSSRLQSARGTSIWGIHARIDDVYPRLLVEACVDKANGWPG